ncbi:MAG: universal stress protein [Mycobacteriales bacterium]
MPDALQCIVACTGPTAEYQAVTKVAVAHARETGARVIFYDVTRDETMTDARPNFWSGEGEAELYDRPLEPVAIEKLGYHDLALTVQQARDGGVDAFGWLPNDAGGQALAEYARRENADLVLMPAGTEQTARYVDDLRKADSDGSISPTDNIRLVDDDSTMVALS